MFKVNLVLVVSVLVCVQAQVPEPKWDTSNWNKTRDIKDLPFCAFILRESHQQYDGNHLMYILMQPDEVTEENLRLLFGLISRQDPDSSSMRVLVETDLDQLTSLVNRGSVSGSSSKSSERAESSTSIRQWAMYRRTKI
jgi:hypothetical protein